MVVTRGNKAFRFKVNMARKPKTPAKPETKSLSLLEALKHVNLAQTTLGFTFTRHCVLHDHWAYGFDGTLSAGHPIQEDLSLAPQTAKLVQALERCDEHLAMAALPSGLSVKSGRFRAVVPCFPLPDMPHIAPDAPVTAIDDRLRLGFAAVAPAVSDSGQFVATAAVRLSAGAVCGTNRHVIIEYWHGIDLPTVLIPKAAIKAIEAVKKPLAQFGFSANSATFYFDDGSWIKTQLYNETYPNVDGIWTRHAKAVFVPPVPDFFDAVKKLKPFVDERNAITLGDDELYTQANKDAVGSSYALPGAVKGQTFNVDFLLMIDGLVESVDYGQNNKLLFFTGNNVRGAISPIERK